MKNTYKITGMTCASCEEKVKMLLSKIEGVQKVIANKTMGTVEIESERFIMINQLNLAFTEHPRYKILENISFIKKTEDVSKQSWFATYRPVLTVFAFILIISSVLTIHSSKGVMDWMNYFMGGFFIAFSFFKFLNLKGFADSYANYDVVAAVWKPWAYVYAFIELLLGIAFLIGFEPVFVNVITFIVMGISLIGVVKSVLDDRKIKCACLGDVFNLPMSTLTIIEDGLMMAMSLLATILMM